MSEYHGYTEDTIIAAISGGQSLTAVAAEIGVQRASLSEWLGADPCRSARAIEARQNAAEACDDAATRLIESAGDPFELAKAKELAHHYRWRASKIAPRQYGERTVVAGDPEAPIAVAVAVSHLTPEQLRVLASVELPDEKP